MQKNWGTIYQDKMVFNINLHQERNILMSTPTETIILEIDGIVNFLVVKNLTVPNLVMEEI